MNGPGDFLGRLAARALGRVSPLRPRLPSRFEPDAPFALDADLPVSEGEAEVSPGTESPPPATAQEFSGIAPAASGIPDGDADPPVGRSTVRRIEALTPPSPLSQPPPRPPGERGAGSPTKAESLSAVPPLLPVGGRAMGEEGRGDEGSFSLFSRPAGGRLGEEGRGDEGHGGAVTGPAPVGLTQRRQTLPMDVPENPPLDRRGGEEGIGADFAGSERPRPRPSSPRPSSPIALPPTGRRGRTAGKDDKDTKEGKDTKDEGDRQDRPRAPLSSVPGRDRLPPERQPLVPFSALREELVPLRLDSPRAGVRAEAGAPPAPESTIRVTIGRIEVRAMAPAPAARPAGPRLTLEEYLRRRSEGRM